MGQDIETGSRFRGLPKVDALLEREDLSSLCVELPRPLVVEAVREAVDSVRRALAAGQDVPVDAGSVAADALVRARARARPSLRRVVNATGVVVHTNLGRSPLAPSAMDAVDAVARGYSTLEYDADSGERGSRHSHVEDLIRRVTGAEAAMAVNNNAAAVLLTLACLARGREAIVSRGQLVEIGGSFRVPDVMAESGAIMVEVGTTNKTHLRDYENAICERTGLLLKVHSSNFRVVGFVQEVSAGELVALGAERGVPVFEDQGSGVLVDLRRWGLPGEPTVSESVAAGVDVVSCSGDKLLGGPQAGILAGKREVVERLKRHPLARAVRLDKMTLAALEATLRLYIDPDRAARELPTLRMLFATRDEMATRAARLADAISKRCGGAYLTGVHDDVSRAGGGALPMADIPTVTVAVSPQGMGVEDLERRLRAGEPPVVARIADGRLLIDPRTLTESDEREVVEALAAASRTP